MKKQMTVLLMALLAAGGVARAAEAPAEAAEQKGLSAEQAEKRAARMVKNAVQLFGQKEDDRAVGLLEAVPRMYPKSEARFAANLELGRHFLEKRVFDRALKELRLAWGAKDGEVRAEALLLEGHVHQEGGKPSEAVMVLRRLTQEYPTSPFANDAFFLIGQIHFEARRWSRALEAFKMVGTAVPGDPAATNAAAVPVLAEAGQRIYAHVRDKDLAVLESLGEKTSVVFTAPSGDRETAVLEPFGRGDGDFLASIPTTGADTKPGDGRLTVRGSERVSVKYVDRNREDGKGDVALVSPADIVSTAALAIMDGAERQRVKGVFAGQAAIVRLRDYDLDETAGTNEAAVTVKVLRRERQDPPVADAPWIVRDQKTLTLRETGSRTAVFTGRLVPRLLSQEAATNAAARAGLAANEIGVCPDEKIVVEYVDRRHLGGEKPETRTGEALVLVGGSTEPQSIVSHSSEASVQARKLLLEARLLQKWGGIFKEVGLDEIAKSKVREGLQRIAEMRALADRASLDRQIVEESYETRWDLHLVEGDLAAAIATCQELVRRYPDTLLADRAFLQIANARRAERTAESLAAAIRIYDSIIRLPKSMLKAEAQFRIGEALEEMARANRRKDAKPDYSGAFAAFRKCAETYPNSAFAGESYKRMVDYSVSIRSYSQAIGTLERVFQDYPDAPWLDEMLLKWGVVLNRTGDRAGALAKFQRLVEEYPGGKAASQAKSFIEKLEARAAE